MPRLIIDQVDQGPRLKKLARLRLLPFSFIFKNFVWFWLFSAIRIICSREKEPKAEKSCFEKKRQMGPHPLKNWILSSYSLNKDRIFISKIVVLLELRQRNPQTCENSPVECPTKIDRDLKLNCNTLTIVSKSHIPSLFLKNRIRCLRFSM